MYQVLYRKYRPRVFADVYGQDHVTSTLKNEIKEGRISHAYLFTGVRGTGKTTCAKIFAKAVNCLHPHNGDPCGECEICKGIDNGSILDVVEMDAASNNGVDDIRDLRDETAYTPSACHYKVYIIDEVHMLSTAAFNALLKTIEEPPAYAVIMLLTTNADSFLQTIRSRCITLNMKSVKDEVIKAYLMNEKHIPDYQADISAAFAQGIVGKAVKLASSDEFNELKESALSLIKRLDDIDLYELGAAVKQIAEYKLKVQDYFDLIMVWYRDVLYMKATNDVNGLIFKDEVYDIKKQAAKHSYQGIEAILEALEKAKIRINANVNFDLVIELLLMTIKEN